MAAVTGRVPVAVRAGGYLVLLLSSALAVFALMAFKRSNEMVSVLAPLAVAHGHPLDPTDWTFHWRISAVVLLVLAAAGTVAGVGMARGRKWGLLLWCVTITVLLIGQGVSNLIAQYAFEQTRIVEGLVTFLLFAASWVVWWRSGAVRREVER